MLIKRIISRMERICLDKRQSNTFSNGLEGADGLPHSREGDADAEDMDNALRLAALHINWSLEGNIVRIKHERLPV